jgi:integrase
MKNEREAILVFILRMTGLRLDEALTLTNPDIDLRAQRIVVRHSKGDAGYRQIPIAPELCPHIDAWYLLNRGFGSRSSRSSWGTRTLRSQNMRTGLG